LDEWWMTSAYLDVRTPLPVHLSPVGLFPQQTFHSEEEFLSLVAKTPFSGVSYDAHGRRQALPPDTAGHMALDMSMYFRMFAVHRVPRPQRDELFFYADGPDPPSHIVVMHNNRASDPLSPKQGGRPFKERELYPQLVEVMERSRSVGPPLGFLTTNDRDSWAQAYERLAIGNEDQLELVQRSILILCLDEPMTLMKPWEIHNPLYMLVGGPNAEYGGNRWYDKTLQFVVGAEGNVGMILEHSPCDGTVVVPLLDHTFTYMKKTSKQTPESASRFNEKPFEIKFELSAETLADIEQAKTKMEKLARDVDVIDYRFEEFGKNFIKTCKLSPDSFIQVSLQLTFYRLHGHTPSTYESASTRMFLLGRTECIRSQSMESDAFCREYVKGKLNLSETEVLLRNAVESHKEYANMAMYGKGVDRVLLGLKKIAEENNRPVPELFRDPGYLKGLTYALCTSQVTARNDILMSFGYIVPGGYGVCYSNQDNNFRFSICTKRHDNEGFTAEGFRRTLQLTLDELGNKLLMLQTAKL
ncbi:choline O-acetyltransferase, putative, partial [Ixodes scapularis]